MAEQENTAGGEKPQPQFSIQRLYLKDASFESPGAPKAFTQEWKPDVNLEINSRTRPLSEELYEVTLTLTVTVKNGGETAYLIEVQQAGLFQLKGIEGPQLQHTLGAFCPTILFPYGREAVDNLALKGSFPPLQLSPVNFEALFAEQMRKQAQEEAPQETH
ncbi:protein-export chaperone SecB [Motiliproteus sp. SC1-56]|uniref:protein-export chaperone SecB n=1 Tax=Motiliproteus sp. SC1-56 TaxID=2799565 RepID=UPI001A8FD8DC|nr:protein-export chaperone SecB [Motiliproteus sp. SC1-56]